jgi:hypothetical protein
LVKCQQFKAAVVDRAPANNPLREALESGKIDSSNFFKSDLYKLPIELNLSKHLNNFQKNLSQRSTISLWLHRDAFPKSPVLNSYGFCLGDKAYTCDRESVLEKLQKDSKKQITLIWTPDTDRLVVPEEIPSLFEAVRSREKVFSQAMQSNAILNCFIWGFLTLQHLKQPLLAQFLLFFPTTLFSRSVMINYYRLAE